MTAPTSVPGTTSTDQAVSGTHNAVGSLGEDEQTTTARPEVTRGGALAAQTPPVGQLDLRVEPGTRPAGLGVGIVPIQPATPLVVTVYGKPITQGSKTKNRYGAVYDDNAATLKPWREAVKTAALEVMQYADRITGPVMVRCIFSFDRPRAHYRTGRNAHLLRENAPPFPANVRSGDIDKIERSCFDALTDAGVWVDDSQIVKVEAEKAWTGTALALPIPGARIEITEMAAPTELVCEDCRQPYSVWYADNDLWNAVMRPDGWTSEPFLCARCFLLRAEPWTEFARVTWPETPSRRDRERQTTS